MMDNRGHRSDCWFYLALPTCEKHLFVAIHEECYIAMPKVAVNDYHALIVLIDHKQQGALVDSKLSPKIEDIKAEFRSHATYFSEGFVRIRRLHSNQGRYHTRVQNVQCIPVKRISDQSCNQKWWTWPFATIFHVR